MIHLQVAVVMMLSCGDERHDDLFGCSTMQLAF